MKPLLWGTGTSITYQDIWFPLCVLGSQNKGLPESKWSCQQSPFWGQKTSPRCVPAQIMPRSVHVTSASLSIWKSLLVPARDTSPLLLSLGAASSLLWGHTSVTLAVIYMERNTTKVCLTASFRHFLATGTKRKKTTSHLVSQLSPKHPSLLSSSQFEELRMWELKLAQTCPLQGWKRQKQGGRCPLTAVSTAGYTRVYTGITVTCTGQTFWNENTSMCTNLSAIQASGLSSMQFQTSKHLFTYTNTVHWVTL